MRSFGHKIFRFLKYVSKRSRPLHSFYQNDINSKKVNRPFAAINDSIRNKEKDFLNEMV